MHSNGSTASVPNGNSVEAKDGDVDGKLLLLQRQQSSGAIVRNKRVYFDVETKMHTLNRIENGEAKSVIIREMHLPPSTLATWIKDRDRIADLYRHSLGTRKRLRRGGSGIGDKSPTPTTIDVDPSTSAHLGGPFVTPSASDETTIGEADDDASKDDEEPTPDQDADEADSTETEVEDGAIERDEEMQPPPQLQPPVQPQVPLSTTPAGATIAIPLLRRAPQMVLPRPLIPKALAPQTQCQQFQQQQPQQQQQHQASVTLRPTLSTQAHLPPSAAVSLGAFLTATSQQTPQHHGLLATQQLLQQQQQQQQHQQHQQQQQQQQHQEQPITKSMLEELFQRYTAQLSAILTFTISPIHSSLEQLNRRLTQLQSDQLETSQRLSSSSRNSCDWLEHTKQHPSEPGKILVAAETNYQMTIPLAWIRDCCDEATGHGPERTLSGLLLKALGRQRLRQLLALGPTALSEDAAFKALRHYVALTQGPVSAQRMCARREELLTQVGGDDAVENSADFE